ncbi:nicotinamide N-methyltransferase-like [Mantella aurantiaca]
MGSFIHHLYSASNFFQEIVVLKSSEKCIMELSRWLHDRTGAYDWTHTSAVAAELEVQKRGGEHAIPETYQAQALNMGLFGVTCLDSSLPQAELESTSLELPLADCVIITVILNVISKNEDEYIRNLEKILKLLKPGGQLLLFTLTDATYFTVRGEQFHILTVDEDFVKNTLSKLGLVIDYCAVQRRSNVSDLTDYKAFMFTVAIKGEKVIVDHTGE